MIDALSPLPQATPKTPQAIEKAAKEFEGLFISTLLQTMFQGLETDGPFGGGHSEEMYRSTMLDEYGKAISKSGGIGIADAIARQMLAFQEV